MFSHGYYQPVPCNCFHPSYRGLSKEGMSGGFTKSKAGDGRQGKEGWLPSQEGVLEKQGWWWREKCSARECCKIFGLLDLFAYTACICADFIVLTVCIFSPLPFYSFIVCWSYAYITHIVLQEIYSTFQPALDRTYCITS